MNHVTMYVAREAYTSTYTGPSQTASVRPILGRLHFRQPRVQPAADVDVIRFDLRAVAPQRGGHRIVAHLVGGVHGVGGLQPVGDLALQLL
eukprot:7085830-Prymnesium_polylepis.1